MDCQRAAGMVGEEKRDVTGLSHLPLLAFSNINDAQQNESRNLPAHAGLQPNTLHIDAPLALNDEQRVDHRHMCASSARATGPGVLRDMFLHGDI